MKYTKKVWIPVLIIVLLVIIIAGFAFINSLSNSGETLDKEAKQIHSAELKAERDDNTLTKAPDMDSIETDAMLKDINDNGTLPDLEPTKISTTVVDTEVLSTDDMKEATKKDDIDNFVKSLGIDDNASKTKDESLSKKELNQNYLNDNISIGVEKRADSESEGKPKSSEIMSDDKIGIEKGADFNPQLVIKKQPKVNLTETYKSPYFTVNYPVTDWRYIQGKNIKLPSFVDIPKKTVIASVEFLNKKNGNSIFLHISHSGGADLSKMTPSETKSYLRYIYNDGRIEKVPVEYINNMRFAVLKFVPRNNKQYLVKQYLSTKNNYLYCITFIEKKASEINQKMIDEILGSMLVH